MANAVSFDRNANKYKCCCNCMHVTTGTLVIGILEVIGMVLQLGSAIGNYVKIGHPYTVSFVIALLSLAISLVAIVLLFGGLKLERKGYLVPHLVLQAIGIVILFILAILAIVFLATGSAILASAIGAQKDTTAEMEKVSTGVMVGIGVAVLVAFALAGFLQIWFFIVVLHCYRFFKDQTEANAAGMTMGIVPPHQVPPSYGYPAPAPAYQQAAPAPYSKENYGNYNPAYGATP